MPPVFSKQKRSTLMDGAFQQIREAIRSGKLKPGDRLVETQLAEEMQISRFPIREALRYLEKEGLVEAKPFKGTYVARLTEKDMEELYSLRSAIEELAVRILIKNIEEDKIKKLESIVADMVQASKNDNIDKMISEDLRFHQTICEMSGHRKLLDVWLNLENQLQIFLTIEKDLFENSYQYVTTHHPILEAIKSGKISSAQKAIRDHLKLAMSVIRQGYWEKNSKKKGKKSALKAPGALKAPKR
ncbi:MAG: GntR family transcriptional regulator [Deltaproteobacteria bacterium]|jgi:DNA-binding GntR family transcriptional regulator|nr:GntR family transcriptional regulator [Deltaproteobacteria bacterium]